MPRSKAAMRWKPNAFEQAMIDQMAAYVVVGQKCMDHIRSLDFPNKEWLWAQVQADFLANPKYPSVVAAQDDVEGRKQFQLKCQAICFPLRSGLPHTPEDHIRIIFAAQAGIQTLMTQDLFEHPYAGEIGYRADIQSVKELRGQASYDAVVEHDSNVRPNPVDLFLETVWCRDKASGKIIEYKVVDCGTSLLSGDYFVLQDDKGRKEQVTAQVLSEMRVD